MIQFIIAYFIVKAAVRNGNKEAAEGKNKACKPTASEDRVDTTETVVEGCSTTYKLLCVLGLLIIFSAFLPGA